MNVIRIPEDPIEGPAFGDDQLVNEHAIAAGVQDGLPELSEARRRVAVTIADAEECMTIAELRAELPDIDHLVAMLLGELQAYGIVGRHTHDDGHDMHYHLTPDGHRYVRAN